MTRKATTFWVATLVFLALDQATKLWIWFNVAEFRPAEGISGDVISVIPGYFDIVHAENPGAAFSMFRSFPDWVRVPMFLTFTCIAMWVVWDQYRKVPKDDRWVSLALGLIASGALGNAVDRIWKSTVTDFLRVYVGSGSTKTWLRETFGTAEWPSFNIADSALLVGVGIFLIATWGEEPGSAENTPTAPGADRDDEVDATADPKARAAATSTPAAQSAPQD